MAEFYVALSREEMAEQITTMINTYNKWYTFHTPSSIINSSANYFVEIILNKVVGCIATHKEHPTLSKILYICVLPEFRKLGVAKKLVELAIQSCETEYVYMTVREDNIPSLKMANSFEFKFIKKTWFRDHWTITLGRKRTI